MYFLRDPHIINYFGAPRGIETILLFNSKSAFYPTSQEITFNNAGYTGLMNKADSFFFNQITCLISHEFLGITHFIYYAF